jgi:hypothetical protein
MFGGRIRIGEHQALREVASRVYAGLAGALAAQIPDAHAAHDASLAAWALVHGLALLLLEERVAATARRGRDEETFVREVLATVRFVVRAAQSA